MPDGQEQTPKVQIQQIRQDVQDDGSRVPSGIPGFDELCDGGFERDSSVLVCGPPGSGKSTFLSQYIFSGAAFYDETGIILSLEQQKETIRQRAAAFGWDMAGLEKEGRLAILNYKAHEVKKLAEEGGGLIWDTITEIGARRVSFDSLSAYLSYFRTQYEAQEAALSLFDMMRKWKCTTLFSVQNLEEDRVRTKNNAEYFADGVVGVYYKRQENTRLRSMEIVKMRGTHHSFDVCPIEIIADEGLVVYPQKDPQK